MALKATLAKVDYDALPEAVRALYTDEGAGKYVLEVEGMTSDDAVTAVNTKLAEFRDNNIALAKKLDKLKDVDPEEYRRLKTEADKAKTKPSPDQADIEVKIAQAVEKATAPLSLKVDSLQQERDDARKALDTKGLQDDLWAIGLKAGVKEEAKGFWLSEATKQFKRDGDRLIAFKGDDTVYSKRKGSAGDPMTADEWALEVAPLDPSLSLLYKGSTGSAAQPKTGGTGANGVRLLPNDSTIISQNLEAIASGKAQIHSNA